MVTDWEKKETKTAINQGKVIIGKWNAILPGTRTQQSKPDQEKKVKTKKEKKADRSSEECDARTSERLQEEQQLKFVHGLQKTSRYLYSFPGVISH